MPLKGTLDTMSLPDLLQWLGAARKTGVVSMSQGSLTKRIFLDAGIVRGSSSNDPSDYLGQLLLSYGRITEEQLRDALESQKSTREVLGAYFVRNGILGEGELARMLVNQTEETIYSLFAWERAQFEYVDSMPEDTPFAVSISVEDILLKGTRRFDEMSRIRELIPSNTVVPRRTLVPYPPQVQQSANLLRIAQAVDGLRSIVALALHTHTSEFLVSKFVFEGMRAQIFEIAPTEKAGPRAPSGDILRAAQRLFDAGDYEGVLTLIDTEGLDPDDPLHDMLRIAETKFVEDAYETTMRPDMVPSLLRPVSDLLNEPLSPEEYFLVSRIDGAWDLRSIVSVSPLREVDALRVLRRLQRRGFIAIQAPVPTP